MTVIIEQKKKNECDKLSMKKLLILKKVRQIFFYIFPSFNVNFLNNF